MSARSRARRAEMGRKLPPAQPVRSSRFEERINNRPQAIWHPLPVSEICMLVGLVGIIIGVAGREPAALAAGIGAMAIGVVEFALREHLTGYRKHRALLAVLCAVAVHFAVIIFVPIRVIGPPALAMDIVVFAVAFFGADRLWRRASARRAATIGTGDAATVRNAGGAGAGSRTARAGTGAAAGSST